MLTSYELQAVTDLIDKIETMATMGWGPGKTEARLTTFTAAVGEHTVTVDTDTTGHLALVIRSEGDTDTT